jgi:hypothetical protein
LPWAAEQQTPVQRFRADVVPALEAAVRATTPSRVAAHRLYEQVAAALAEGPKK